MYVPDKAGILVVEKLELFSKKNIYNRISEIVFFACHSKRFAQKVAKSFYVGVNDNTKKNYLENWENSISLKIVGPNAYGTIDPKGNIRVVDKEEDYKAIEEGWQDGNVERTMKILKRHAVETKKSLYSYFN